MPIIERLGDHAILIDGLEIKIEYPGHYDLYKETNDTLYMAKSEAFLASYEWLAGQLSIKNLVEVGIFRGGGTVFLDRFFRPEKLLAVEYSAARLPLLDNYATQLSRSEIRIEYDTDQSDKRKLVSAARDFFGTSPLDLVIDDASHWYEPSKASFEALFPLVRPGGYYAIEDWGWSHADVLQAEGAFWSDQPALTNLAFDLVGLHGTRSDIVPEISFKLGALFVKRGGAVLPDDWSMDASILTRGRPLPKI